MEDNWTDAIDNGPSDLISISTSTTITPEIVDDMPSAYQIGYNAYINFTYERINPTK